MALPGGLAVAVQAGSHDALDGDNEQDGEGHIRADEGNGEDGGHDVEGGRGGMGQRGEEGDERTGESRAHERGEAERPDAGAGLRVGHTSLFVPPTMPCVSVVYLAPSVTVGNTCPV